MNQTFQKIVGGVLAVTALMGLSACGSKTEDTKADGKTYKVGIVQFVDDASLNQIEAAIEAELDAKAKELGVTFDYTLYNGQGDATTLNQIGAELVGKGVDLIVPIATPAVKIMQSATEDTEIPIVFSAVSDPVGSGIVDALDAPGGRITGTSDALNTKGLLDLMLAQNPDTKTVGLLYSKSEDSSKQPIADAKAYLEGKGIRCVEKTGTTTDEITSAVDALIAEKVDAVFTPTDNTVMTAELAIYEKFLNAKIPQYCGADSFALNGAFVGYGVDYTALGKMTADMVVQVLQMKSPGGTLSWKSGVSEASAYGVNGTAELADAIQSVKGQNIYLVAVVSTCVDSLMAERYAATALQTASGSAYTDGSGGWVDPYNTFTRTYLVSLCKELRELGFDEVAFSYLQQPLAATELKYASQSGSPSRTDAVVALAKYLRANLTATGLRVSAIVSADSILQKQAELSGQDMTVLPKLLDRVCVFATTDNVSTLQNAIAADSSFDAATRFVPFLAKAPESGSYVTTG